MNIEDIVTSLELSKKLKELSVPQKSIFYWGETLTITGHEFNIYFDIIPACNILAEYAAFTASELMEFLPYLIKDYTYSGKYHLKLSLQEDIFTNKINYCLNYVDKNLDHSHMLSAHDEIIIEDTNEANARAKMLIYLVKNKIIEIPK